MNPESKRKILLVEDDPVAAAITSAMLKHNGYDVVTVATGIRAIDRISNDSSVELILMDIDLGPGMSGPDAAREILKTNDIPIVFLTSHSEREMVYKVRAITRYGYVIKNSGDFVLLSSIEMAFELFESHIKLKKTSEQLAESEQSIRRKLDSILMPDIDLRHLELSDLIDKDALQSLIDKFYQLTGFGIGILDLKGKVIVAAGWQDMCIKFHRLHPETHKYCIESDTILSSGVREGEYKLYKCKNNLWDIVTPIMIDGRHVGNVFLGQFFFDDEVPDEEFFRARAELYGFDEGEYLSALRRVPRWKRGDVYNVMDYYTGLAEIIKKLSYGNIRLARAVAERDRINEILSLKNEQFSMVTDNMVDLVSMIDISLRFKYVSPSFEKSLGYKVDDLVGKGVLEYVHPDDQDRIKSDINNMFINGSAKAEYRYRDCNGVYLWYESKGKMIYDETGNATGAIIGSREITDRKYAMQELLKSEKRFRDLFRSMTSGFILHKIIYNESGHPVDFIHIEINSVIEKMYGRKSEEIIGRSVYELLPGLDPEWFNIGMEVALTGETVEHEGYNSYFNKCLRIIVYKPDQESLAIIIEDISRRKEIENKLSENEEKFSKAFYCSPLIMALSDADTGRYIDVNDCFCSILGFKREEVLGKTSVELNIWKAVDRETLKKEIIKSGNLRRKVVEIHKKNGDLILCSFSGEMIIVGGKQQFLTVAENITEYLEAERKLKESEDIFSKSFMNSPLIMTLSSLETGHYIEVNDNFCRISGFTREEAVGRSSLDLGLIKLFEREKILKKIASSGNIKDLDISLYKKNGDELKCSYFGEILIISGRKMLLSIIHDITEQKKTIKKLEQSEGRYKLLVENSPLSIFLVRDGRYIYANPAAASRLGYSSPEEITGLEVEKTISPDSIELIRQRIINAGSGNQNENIELHIRRKDGSLLITESLSLPITLGDGPAILVIGNDVTRQRHMQIELERNEEKYRTIADFTYDWEFWIGVDGRMQYVSPSCEVITGFTASEFIENPGLLSEIVFPEDSNSPCLSHEAVFEIPAVNETEFRIKTKNGETRWIAHTCRAVYDKTGKFAGRRGSNRDITLRKEMETELQNTYSRVERLWHIATLSGADMKTICDSILQSITMITESPYGFYGFINDDETVMTIHSWSGLAMERCSMADKPAEFIISECGIWAEAVRNRGDLLINDYSIEHPAKKGYPEGHVKLEKLMVIPVFKGEKIIAIGAVANKKDNYNNKDALIVRTFMANVQSVIDRKMGEYALRESENKLKILLNATSEGAFLMDKNGIILEANSTLCARFGKNIEELTGLNVYSLLPEHIAESRRRIIDNVILTCEPAHFEDEREGILLESNVYPVTGNYGEVNTIAVFSRDITERKKAEMEIQNLLEQKEMLLREVHHRIKNNMNTVAGLLKLQSLSIEEPAAIEALNDARGRVQNMMLIYDRLYRTADYKNLNVKDYFENLINEIIKLFPNHNKVNVVKKIDDFNLDSKLLFTMGIMINELITNTFKYAFHETDNPELAFSLSFNDGRVSFAVKDNGPGLPDNVKTGNRNGFGLNLVSSLAEQLEGEMVFGDTPGTEIKVSFML